MVWLARRAKLTAVTVNAQGRITQITQPDGQVNSYAYDPTNTYLTAVTTEGQTTSFTYITGSTPQEDNAVASITNPAGVTESFTYDAEGRLIGSSLPGRAEPVTLFL